MAEVTDSHKHSSLPQFGINYCIKRFYDKALPGVYQRVEGLKGLTLPTNIKLGRKGLQRTNTLAYYKIP
jgi:hypothetical protein